MNKVSVIVPAYNEENTILQVLQVVAKSGLADEIIVVDDGSTDKTAKQAAVNRVSVISLPENKGKSYAMAIGLKQSAYEIVLFLDADLVGLQVQHILDLLHPVVNGEVLMTVGKFHSGEFWTTLSQHITPFLSGQRAIKKEALKNFKNMEDMGFGVETALTLFFRKNKMPVKEVLLYNLKHVVKEKKFGFLKGFYLRLKMYYQIIRSFRRIYWKMN